MFLRFDNMFMEVTTGLPARAFKQLGEEEIDKVVSSPPSKVVRSKWCSKTKSWETI